MQLNSTLIGKIGDLVESSLSNHKNGHYVIEHDLGTEIELVFHRDYLTSHWTLNGEYLRTGWDINSESKAGLHAGICNLLIHLAIVKADQEDMLMDLLTGVTTNLSWGTPLGITVKFSKEVDSQTLLICQSSHPDIAIYGFEEAVNQSFSVGPNLLTDGDTLAYKIRTVLIDCVMADLISIDVQF